MKELLKPFDEAHIFRMTDDTGIFQHTLYNIPSLEKGYTTDDNARALIMAVKLYEKDRQPKYLTLVYRYLAFVLYAQNDRGHFRNFMSYDRKFTERQGSEECFGRCLWALTYTLASNVMPRGVKDACESSIKRALPMIVTLKSLRGQAYSLIALALIDGNAGDHLIIELADSIAKQFECCKSDENWHWFEDTLTYDNAVLPWAMFAAFQKIGHERFSYIARVSLRFFDQSSFRNGYFSPVGCRGWWVQGGVPALFDQQPVEASMSVLAHLAAYRITGDEEMLALAKKSFAWYMGENSSKQHMIDFETGGCFDGIMADGLNRNQGSESIVGYCIAKLELEHHTLTVSKIV